MSRKPWHPIACNCATCIEARRVRIEAARVVETTRRRRQPDDDKKEVT